MKQFILLSLAVALSATASAQLKIGASPTTVQNGQLLQLEKNGTRGGLKIAEVALTGTTDVTTINIPAAGTGTMIWNTATAGSGSTAVTPGFYIWNGTAWDRVATSAATNNLYTANGTLTGNRTVAQGSNTLAFTGTVTNAFSVAGSTLSVDAANKRVGIGTAAPDVGLDATGSIHFADDGAASQNTQGGYLTWNRTIMGGIGQGYYGFLNHQGLGNGGFLFSVTNNNSTFNELMRITGNGLVGIGTSTPGNPLQMASGAFVSASGVWTNASDARLKSHIRSSRYGLAEVMKLHPVDYTMNIDSSRQVGFIAQEVRSIVPEVVLGKEGDLSKGETLGVSYGNLVPVLTRAIQEQQAEIEQLKAAIRALQAK